MLGEFFRQATSRSLHFLVNVSPNEGPESLLFPMFLKVLKPTACFGNDQAFGTEIDGNLSPIASSADQPIVGADPAAPALAKRRYDRPLLGQSLGMFRKEPLDHLHALGNGIAFFHIRLALERRRPHRDDPRPQRQLAQAEQGADRRLFGADQPQMAIDRLFPCLSITAGRR